MKAKYSSTKKSFYRQSSGNHSKKLARILASSLILSKSSGIGPGTFNNSPPWTSSRVEDGEQEQPWTFFVCSWPFRFLFFSFPCKEYFCSWSWWFFDKEEQAVLRPQGIWAKWIISFLLSTAPTAQWRMGPKHECKPILFSASPCLDHQFLEFPWSKFWVVIYLS